MALVNPNIAMGYRGIELANPLAQYGQVAAIQNAQNQNQLANMQMQEYSRAREEEQGIRNRLTGGASLEDPETRNFLLGSKAGREILQRQSDLQKSQTDEAARRAKLMADTEGMYRNMSGQISNKADAATFLQRMVNDPALKGSPIASIPIMQQIQRIPEDPQGLDNWVKQFALGTTKYITENKPVTQQINRMGQTDIVQIPGLGGAPRTVGTFADVPMPAAVVAQKKDIAKAGAPNISMSTEKKYGEQLAGKIADRDDAKLGAAESAPRLAESANRIIDIVSRGDVFTGPAADIKLNIARALNIAGANNQEKIANTEQLIAGTGQSTLDAIKGAGLGTGQGFTDKDLKFLQGIAGGTINLTAQTLTELATLQHRVATRAADAWSKRSKEIPKDVLAGMGISTEPIKVPPLASVMKRGALGIPQGAIDDLKAGAGTDAQFDAQFGPGAAARVRGVK
jgi:hypothetical protein